MVPEDELPLPGSPRQQERGDPIFAGSGPKPCPSGGLRISRGFMTGIYR